jgi:hypothetical protein
MSSILLKHLTFLASEPDSQEAMFALKKIRIKCFLDELTSDKATIEKIAQNSVFHPNGFYKLVIAEGIRGERVRLHFWTKESNFIVSKRKPDIHDHFWKFSSLVITGALESQLFVPSTAHSASEYRHYKLFDVSNHSYKLQTMGNANLLFNGSNICEGGDIYYLSESECHRVECVNDTATLVLQGYRQRKDNNIYTTEVKNELSVNTMQKLKPDDVFDVLNVIKALA